jgi:hypothetical protein
MKVISFNKRTTIAIIMSSTYNQIIWLLIPFTGICSPLYVCYVYNQTFGGVQAVLGSNTGCSTTLTGGIDAYVELLTVSS